MAITVFVDFFEELDGLWISGILCLFLNDFQQSLPVTSFFYPIVYICFAHVQKLAYSTAAHTAVIGSDGLISNFCGILTCLSVERIFVIAVFAYTALCARPIISRVYLVFHFSALRTPAVFIYCLLFHIPIISQKTLLVH